MGIIEYGSWLVMKSQVERVNYSIASVFRERNALYAKNEIFSKDEVKNIYELAKNLTYHRYDEGLCLRIEAIHFADSEKKNINIHQNMEYGSGLCKKLSSSSLDKKIEFSPYSNRKRWIPLYQVSLIIPTPKGSLNTLLKSVDILPEYVSTHTILLAR